MLSYPLHCAQCNSCEQQPKETSKFQLLISHVDSILLVELQIHYNCECACFDIILTALQFTSERAIHYLKEHVTDIGQPKNKHHRIVCMCVVSLTCFVCGLLQCMISRVLIFRPLHTDHLAALLIAAFEQAEK